MKSFVFGACLQLNWNALKDLKRWIQSVQVQQ